ncbi:hypothetical protein Golob_000696, partial [Gossypium lobatum]|nr:hypothetical protein [Gossypium lobatum]
SKKKQILTTHKEDQIQQNILAQRYPLTDNCVHLHIEGSVNVSTGIASTGGVVRNHLGDWIMGFNHFLGNCFVFYAKLWGILDELTLLKEQGLERILIHTNNIEVAQVLQKDFQLVRSLRSLDKFKNCYNIKSFGCK